MPKSKKQKPAPMQMDNIDAMLESAIASLGNIYGRSTPETDYEDAVSALDRLNEIKRVRDGKPFVDEKGFNKQTKELLKWLNCLERKPGSPGMTIADLCNRHEAVGLMDGEKDLHGWDEDVVFIRAESLKRHIRNLTPDGYEWLTTPEKIMGWFEEQNDDECDAEGEFMSTPCWNEEMDEDTDLEDDIFFYIDDCARGGLLLIR
jgi:succinate dehydrogenase/fumarate reductase-like Fe-S protein